MSASGMAGTQWMPGQVSVTEKVYNTKGELEEDELTVIGFSAAGDHQIHYGIYNYFL